MLTMRSSKRAPFKVDDAEPRERFDAAAQACRRPSVRRRRDGGVEDLAAREEEQHERDEDNSSALVDHVCEITSLVVATAARTTRHALQARPLPRPPGRPAHLHLAPWDAPPLSPTRRRRPRRRRRRPPKTARRRRRSRRRRSTGLRSSLPGSAATSPPPGWARCRSRSRSVDFWATINGGALVELYKVVGSRDHARFVAAAMQLHGITEGQATDALARFAEEEQWPIPSRTQSGGGGAGPSGVTPRAVVPARRAAHRWPAAQHAVATRPRSVEGAPHVSQSGGMDCAASRT